jgi:hypothetical protein
VQGAGGEEEKKNQTHPSKNPRMRPVIRMPKDPNLFNKLLENDAIKEAISDPEKMKAYIASNPVL